MKKEAFLFGYGAHGSPLANSMAEEDYNLHIIESDEKNYQKAKEDGFRDVRLLDVTKDADLERLEINDACHIVCVMDDDHLNVFLTLSLHALFPKAIIVAVSNSIHTTEKLKIAGASKIIDQYVVSANRIHHILQKPVATQLLDRFISDDYAISFREMEIPDNSHMDGMMVDDVDFSGYGVLLVGMIDARLSHNFSFVTAGIEHRLDSGDTIVCIGDNKDLDAFEERLKIAKRETK